MSELVRSFVAVSISDGARRQIAELLAGLRRETGVVRWVKPESLHLTLAFLGEVPPDFLESTKPLLTSVAAGHKPFAMRLNGVGVFPSPSRARTVWIGMDHGKSEVCALQRDVVKALCAVGYQPEKRPFSPHLTIGRMRIPDDLSRAVASPFESESFPVSRLVLFRSVLSPAGPTYSVLTEFPLSSGPGQLA